MDYVLRCIFRHVEMSSIFFISILVGCNPKISDGLRKNDLNRDIEMITTEGRMLIRLSDSTPIHRDNFLRLVKQHFYDSIIFHRVISSFMIQAGDPNTKLKSTSLLSSLSKHTIPAEFREQLFHKKGMLAAARLGDNINPQKASSATQFYIVHGKRFTDAGLDSVETFRLNGRKLPPAHREVYKALGGTPHLDQNYTIFGEVIRGLEVIDSIASRRTSGNQGADKPLKEIMIVKAQLVRRRKHE